MQHIEKRAAGGEKERTAFFSPDLFSCKGSRFSFETGVAHLRSARRRVSNEIQN
jgi:hypothetical protein